MGGKQVGTLVGTSHFPWANLVSSELPSALESSEELQQAHTHTYTHAHTQAQTHTHTHAHTQAHTHTHAHTQPHTHTHTYTPETRSIEAKTLTPAAIKSAEVKAIEARASAHYRETPTRWTETKPPARDIEVPGRGTEAKATGHDTEAPRRGTEAKATARDMEVHRRGSEEQLMEDSRIHLCSSVVTSEVQCLKSEVELLKRSLEEEVQARKTGDALNGEACMQLQAVLELEQQQRAQLATNIDDHVNGAITKLSAEISDQRLALDAEVHVRVQGHEKLESHFQSGSADSFRALRNEVEQEIKQRTADIERLRNSLQVEVATRATSTERWSEFAKKIDDLTESIRAEKAERQMEERSLQQLITTLAEQTNLAIEEESTGIWDALHSHNHDVSLENHGAHLFSVQAQSMTQPGLLQTTTKSARKINLKPGFATQTSPSLTRNLTENSITMQTTYHPEVMQSMQSQNYANEFGQLTDLPKSSFPLKRITLPGLRDH